MDSLTKTFRLEPGVLRGFALTQLGHAHRPYLRRSSAMRGRRMEPVMEDVIAAWYRTVSVELPVVVIGEGWCR